jgi:hypothetical protein
MLGLTVGNGRILNLQKISLVLIFYECIWLLGPFLGLAISTLR